MGFSQAEFSPYIQIRYSPRRPNRDPNRTLSNELLLFSLLIIVITIFLARICNLP